MVPVDQKEKEAVAAKVEKLAPVVVAVKMEVVAQAEVVAF